MGREHRHEGHGDATTRLISGLDETGARGDGETPLALGPGWRLWRGIPTMGRRAARSGGVDVEQSTRLTERGTTHGTTRKSRAAKAISTADPRIRHGGWHRDRAQVDREARHGGSAAAPVARLSPLPGAKAGQPWQRRSDARCPMSPSRGGEPFSAPARQYDLRPCFGSAGPLKSPQPSHLTPRRSPPLHPPAASSP